MTVDEHLVITACEAVTLHSPYATCGGGAQNMGVLAGLALKAGFLKAANERLRGPLGCTHIREMLQQIATVAHQTMWPVRERARARRLAAEQRADPAKVVRPDPGEDDGSIRLLDTCFAYARNGAVVKQRWPHLASGQSAAAAN
jgi:hypothetical protein